MQIIGNRQILFQGSALVPLKEKKVAIIRPFTGIRPTEARAAEIAALPYDVYNRQEAKAVVSENPLSFLRIDRAETNFEDRVDMYDDKVYQKAHDLLWEEVDKGYFIQDEMPCYYLYELTMDQHTQTGIVACASIDDYENGTIKRHENTREEKEQDRIRHVDTCNAQTGPIFLTYRSQKKINEIVEKIKATEPLYDFTSQEEIRQRVFMINDGMDIAAIRRAFKHVKEIYIADGHHRAASAVRVGQMRRLKHPDYTGGEEFNYFLSVLFPDNELTIMDYNRVVKDLNGFRPEAFLAMVTSVCTVSEPHKKAIHPTKKGEFAMYLKERWYLCEFLSEYKNEDPVDGLDVSLLQNQILYPMLDIRDPKTSDRIDFVGGIRGLSELEKRCNEDCAVAFAMYPTAIGDLFKVADANRLMPPKSTWFEPKLRSGLFIHKLDY